MSRSTLRRTASAAVLALALSSLAACGGGDDDSSADDSGGGSGGGLFSKMRDGGASSEGTADPDAEPAEPDATQEGEPTAGEEVEASEMVDIFASAFEEASTATFTMATEGAAAFSAEGVADFSTTPPDMRMTIEVGETQPLTMVLVDNMMYQQNPGSSKYTATSLDDPSSPYASLGQQLDIRSQFATMEKAITGATYVGEEDGFEHYSLVLDSATLLSDQGVDPSTLPKDALPPSFTYELYFDEDGYFRKMVTDLGELGGTTTATYDAWGEPVDIEAPPASQIQ
jgi:outer membrane lipoprotein-sorting protein